MATSDRIREESDLCIDMMGNDYDIAVISEFSGFSGKPLLYLNSLQDIENEILYPNKSTFRLVATAKAQPEKEGTTARIAALYVEVPGQDPYGALNIYTGKPTNYML
ncbi:hypothetical protein DFQ28_006145 [Apophysomyces sp. BC1034]|nr:hypothetical protein DFQ30_000224 [Apophysomyces sp. BC1015]KAG0193140.1 hypothetical protein DFQ28_006145 [Apophysomyces sp. BC1034]